MRRRYTRAARTSPGRIGRGYARRVLRVLVVDRSASTRDVVAELLGDLAIDVVWAPRDGATAALRGAIADGRPFDCIVLDGEPAPTPQLVRELVTQGGGVRVIVSAAGPD